MVFECQHPVATAPGSVLSGGLPCYQIFPFPSLYRVLTRSPAGAARLGTWFHFASLVGRSVASSLHVRVALNKNEETLAFGKHCILPAPESLDQTQWREGREDRSGDNDLCSNFAAVTGALDTVAGT